jgi:tetratricopeptide (TPR) repeat protein
LGGGLDGDFVRNPLFKPDLPDQPVEDLLNAMRAGVAAGEERFFTGREAALARLVAWLALAKPGLFVVTGPPGCGKSALVGRLADLSAPAERARLLQSESVPAALDPGEASIHAQLQARGATIDSAAEELARQLGVDPATGSFGVLGEARKRRLSGRPLAVVVDGLDEALQMSQPLVDELLLPLAREARVIVATRDIPFENTSLVAILGGPEERIDLGEDLDGTLRDVRRYVVRRLAGLSPKMDPERVADEIARGEAEPAAAAPFLLARLLTSQLRDQPVDTDSPDWRLTLASTVESALERDLGGVVIEIDGRPQPGAARELLRALAPAHGSGFPTDDVWPAVATALSPSGTVYGRDAAYAALAALGRHIIASSEGGQPVYRIAHRQLSDYLTRLPQPVAGALERNEELRIAQAIAGTYEQWLDEGHAPERHAYLWRFAWRHFADAGAPGLQYLERLVERDRAAFLPDLAAACDVAGLTAGAAVRFDEALRFHEQAVAVRRDLGDVRQLTLSLFQLSIARTMTGDEEGADDAADEATELARSLPDGPQGRVTLAGALLAKSIALVRDGRYETARRLADEAIELDLPDPESDDEDAWMRRVTAQTTASRAAQLSGDAAAGERYARAALEIADAHDALTNAPIMFFEVCSNLAYLLVGQLAMGMPGGFAGVDTGPGQRVLDEFRRSGRRGDLADLLTAKALTALARSHAINASLGLAVADASRAVPELIDASLDLTRPNAAVAVDYGVMFADATMLLASLAAATDPDTALQALQECIAALRSLPADNLIVSLTLGQVLDTVTAVRLNALLTTALSELPQAIEQQQEAIVLLRRGGGRPFRAVLAAALSRQAGLLAAMGNEQDIAMREEAIGALRELGTGSPAIGLMLLANLADQAGRLLDQRTEESIERAREALQIAAGMPDSPQTRFYAAVARINLANAQTLLGADSQDVGTLFRSAIASLEVADGQPVLIAGLLANAHAGLAQVLTNEGDFANALEQAQKGVALIDVAAELPLTAATRWVTRVALGRALRGTGAVDEGRRVLQEVVQALREAVLISDTNIGLLAATLNTGAADLWDDTLEALRDHPRQQRRLALMRRRPAGEVDLTVQMLLDMLDHADPGEQRLVHDVARSHRALDPANFDRAWHEQRGDGPPDWLLVPVAVEWAVIGWLNVPTWPLSHEYLQAHPVLLVPQADIVLEEFADPPDRREMIDQHLQLLAAARRDGVDAAYAPMMLEIEVGEWLRSDAPQEHLARHPELQRPEVQEKLQAYSAEGEARATVFAAILELTRRGEQDLAFQALQKPDTMGGRLRAAWRGTDAPRLEALATIVSLASDDEAVALQSELAVLVAQVLQQREPEVMLALRERLQAQYEAQRAALAEVVNDAIEHHRSAESALSTLLTLLS